MNRIAKTSYIILGAALMLGSCSQEETPVERPDGNDRRIVFHTSLPEVSTKAMEITRDLPFFHMTAFDETDSRLIAGDTLKGYFYNKKLIIESGSTNAVSDECVWPDPGFESDIMHFFAYYPELKSGASLVNGTDARSENKEIGYKINGYRVETDIADQVDFVTAYTKGSMDENYFSGINLNFRHQLSRIEVKTKGSHKSCDIEIAGVRIANAPMQGTFEFQKSDADGTWTDLVKGNAEYIFREGDAIVKVGAEPVSIMGSKIDSDNDNCALLIPTTCAAWDYTNDAGNNGKGMYLNVLLRIIDKTPTTGNGKVQYPYFDNSQGLNAMNIPREYFAVITATGTVSKRLYKNGNGYCTDAALTQPYTLASGEEIREFGWAALPIRADWQPGYSYSYTLDYTSGVGVHGPDVTGEVSPKAGDPIISDRVGVSVSVNEWQGLNGSTTHTVDVPGA
ncbi:MAG: fimbrillin family protein [Muribaculaceae bacterium]|nr:fimbrillin family protein [Muribaculaceae bacterium]